MHYKTVRRAFLQVQLTCDVKTANARLKLVRATCNVKLAKQKFCYFQTGCIVSKKSRIFARYNPHTTQIKQKIIPQGKYI